MSKYVYRNYSKNNSKLSKHLEKISSVYRINRSADDAVWLAISGKMRAQITGLNQGIKNAKVGISLCSICSGKSEENKKNR